MDRVEFDRFCIDAFTFCPHYGLMIHISTRVIKFGCNDLWNELCNDLRIELFHQSNYSHQYYNIKYKYYKPNERRQGSSSLKRSWPNGYGASLRRRRFRVRVPAGVGCKSLLENYILRKNTFLRILFSVNEIGPYNIFEILDLIRLPPPPPTTLSHTFPSHAP